MGFFGPRTVSTDVGALTAPTDLSGLEIWYDFSDSTKIFDSNTGGSTPANGGAIGRIEDKSGNARNAVQATANNRPAYQTNIQNGLSVARFDGTNDQLTLSSYSFPANYTLLCVVATDWTTGKYRSVFNTSNWAETAGNYLGTLAVTDQEWKSKDIGIFPSGYGASRKPRATGGATRLNGFTANSFHVFSLFAGSSSCKIFADKTEIVYSSMQIDVDNASDTTSITLRISGSDFWDRDIGEFFIYNSILSDTNRQKAENYLATKWGIA